MLFRPAETVRRFFFYPPAPQPASQGNEESLSMLLGPQIQNRSETALKSNEISETSIFTSVMGKVPQRAKEGPKKRF